MAQKNQLPPSEIKAKNAEEAMQEMLPFAIYTIVPVVITICIAYFLGSTAQ